MLETSKLVEYLIFMIVFLFSLSVHEAAHAWTAERFGDSTARYLGRVTLNPISHIDVLGTLIFPTIGFFYGGLMFGWAKPVPWNPLHVKDRRKADIWISAAGPISNIVLLSGFLIIIKLLQWYQIRGDAVSGGLLEPLQLMCVFGAFLNITLAIFNMLPIPPLDGSWILPHFLPRRLVSTYDQIRPYGFIILLGCLSFGILGRVLKPFHDIIWLIISL